MSNAHRPLLFPLSINACSMLVCTASNVACLREMHPQIVLTTSSCHHWCCLLLPRHIKHGKDRICHGQKNYHGIIEGQRKLSESAPHPRSNKHPWLMALSKGETHPHQQFHECQCPELFQICSLLATKVEYCIKSQSNPCIRSSIWLFLDSLIIVNTQLPLPPLMLLLPLSPQLSTLLSSSSANTTLSAQPTALFGKSLTTCHRRSTDNAKYPPGQTCCEGMCPPLPRSCHANA